MTWSITLAVKDGALDHEASRVVGTPPNGHISINGHETEQGHGVGLTMAGAQVSVYVPKPVATEEDLAREAYAGYGTATGGLTHRGEPMPAWQDLPEDTRNAWVQAVAVVAGRLIPF